VRIGRAVGCATLPQAVGRWRACRSSGVCEIQLHAKPHRVLRNSRHARAPLGGSRLSVVIRMLEPGRWAGLPGPSGYDPGYENRVNLCPLVSAPVRSNSKPPRRHLTRGLRDERCPQWLSVKCSICLENDVEHLGNRCSIRLSYGALRQEDSALRSAGKSNRLAVCWAACRTAPSCPLRLLVDTLPAATPPYCTPRVTTSPRAART